MISKSIELTENQKGIYFDCLIDNPLSYNISASILLENVDEKHFENALQLLIGEQEALRSDIEIINDMPTFAIHDRIEFKLTKQDISDHHGEQDEILGKIVEEEIGKAFVLTKAPLFRTRLVKLDHKKHLFLFCIHHIISDGLSLEIFKKKMSDYYDKLVNKKRIVLKKDDGFSRFIEQENAKLKNGEFSKEKEYWINKLQGAQPVELQADYSKKQKNSGLGREKSLEIPSGMLEDIHHLAIDQEVTDFMFFLAAFGVLMNRYTRNEDVVFSSPFSYRPDLDFEESIGYFVSMLPMRFNIENSERFSTILEQASKELIDVYKHIGYPNNLIMRDSQLVPMPGSPSIFDVSFVYDIYEETDQKDLKTKVLDQDNVTFPGNVMVILNKTPNKDLIKIQYKPEIFSDEMIELLGHRFLKLLEALISDVDIKIEDIDLLLENEENRILHEFNHSSFFSYQPKTIIDIFNAKVADHPNRTALILGDKTETYASVNAKANQLARKILQRKKGANDAIGVQLDRSMEMVISLLAILKAGCAYVPIDPSFPTARKEFIFGDANISHLITSRHLLCKEDWNIDILFVDDSDTYSGDEQNPLVELDPYSLAYIMYTSGSTGKPKGVMIENHSVVNTLLDLERRFPMEKQDVFLLKTPYTFDVSVTELFGWFMGEGSLLILEPGGEKNPQLILDEIEKHLVTHINFVPTMFRLFLELFDIESNITKLNSLKWIFLGGEAVTSDIIQNFQSLNTNISLENVYGPTESTIWVSHYSLKDCPEKKNISIGQPLNEMRWYVVGKNDNLQPVGVPGELCLSGVGLARGYLNRDELTKEKFVPNPFFQEGVDPEYYRYMYRTGDLAHWLPNGTIDYLGRIDFQVKVRGVRLEIGEIENALAEYEGIVQAVVVVKEEPGKPAVLCAFYLSEHEISTAKIKGHLSDILPAYMIPSFFVHKNELPLNQSDKVDKNALIAELVDLKNTSSEYLAPSTDLEHLIASAWQDVLSISKVGLDDNFFDIGGNSLLLIQVHNKLRKVLKKDFSITLFLQSPTVRQLAEHFSKDEKKVITDRGTYFQRNEKIVRQDIAVIGMSVHVPGAQNTHDFWNNLKSGKESIYFYNDDELKKLGIFPEVLNSPNYVKAKGRVDGIDYFDPQFFDYTPGEVRMMSPQLRLLYQGTWEALEDAGYYPGSNDSKIGLFYGGSDDFEWYRKVLFGDGNYSDKYQAFTLSTNHFLATRVAHKLDIKGPVYSALTGCSTTLVTPHLGCQSLILGECDVAVAGGITIELPNEGGYYYEEGMMFSPDGHCRPFDAKAQGTVFSNGMGLVVLKRLDEALHDGDQIYAVIKGSAINNDGKQKIGFVAPSVEGQAEAVQEAYRVAGIDPETVSYVEAHGTGTSIGDPIEVESLTKAFLSDKKQFCILGSVKGNVGHTDTAAGAVGLAKVALSLKHKYIPGTVNYQEPNPKIDFTSTPFVVNATGSEWDKEGILRAGINSFGVGGTNAHMVLEETPTTRKSSPSDEVNLLPFSAKSSSALLATSKKVVEHLLHNPEINLSDVAWTLQIGRKPFSFRKTLVINEEFFDEPEIMIEKLNEAPVYEVKPEEKNVYFMFPGQGSQYQGMGRDLYFSADRSGVSRIFKGHIDQIFDLLTEEERKELLELMYGQDEPGKINQTENSQFALFATSYALAKTMIELGIIPDGMIGHSIGEVTAAAVSGVFELKDAVEVVRIRGQVMQKQEPGVMLAVMASALEVEKELESDVWLSLENTDKSCVVGGSEKAIAQFEEKVERLGWKSIRVKTSHAFHTPMMEKAAQEFREEISAYQLHEPQIPIVSNVSGHWVQEKEMTRPEYWSNHILQTVKFSDNLSEVLKNNEDVFIEVGAGRTLSTFARQQDSTATGQTFVNLVRHPQEATNDVEYINQKLGDIWSVGIDLHWDALKGDAIRQRLSLPTYVFDKMHFPVDIQPASQLDPQFSTQQEVAATTIVDAPEFSSSPAVKSALYGTQIELENIVMEAYRSVFGFDTIQVDQDFFALGGDSLKAVSLAAAIKNLLGIKVDISHLFKYPNPGALAAFLRSNSVKNNVSSMIKPLQKRDYYPLSYAQRRMYALYLLDKNNLAYNLPSVTMIEGHLDRERVEEALEKLTKRHESLRTSFEVRENQPVQVVHSTAKVPIRYSEKSVSRDHDIHQLIHDFIKPFDLEKAPLFRVELVKVDVQKYVLLFDLHHIIADGTSVEIITRDFNELYFGEDIPPLKIQYKDFAVWQNEFLKSAEVVAQRDYWLNQLTDELPLLQLPTDYHRPAVKDFEGSRVFFSMDEELTKKLIDFSRDSGATLYMIMLSAWYVLLARYSGQEDMIVGTPVAGRTHEEIEETVGMFVNMLAMRNRPENKKRFIDFLDEVKANTLKAFENQDYQFDELVEQLDLKRELNRNALFDVCFDFQNMEFYDLEIEGIRFSPYQFETKTAAYDLILTCQENKEKQVIEGFLEYSTGLFKKETVERMVEHFRMILTSITKEKDILIENIDLLSQEERQLITGDLNNSTVHFDDGLLIQGMFEQNVRINPEKTALIVASGKKLTYRELNEKANTLAWHLIDLGIEKDSLVGVMCGRDEHLFVSLLGVLKAGGAYVPIDPEFPKERISYMLSECNVSTLICPQEYQESVDFNGTMIDCSTLDINLNNDKKDTNPSQRGANDSLACVIFTSGSTGKPKGVMINQSSIVNFIHDIRNREIFQDQADRVLCVTTLSFDIFGFESIVPLCTGHSVYLADENEQLDPAHVSQKILEHNVTHVLSTVSRIKVFVENPEFDKALKQLKCILSGGENYPLQLLQDLQKRSEAKIYNMYGPTETTIWSTTKELTHTSSINIGHPIAYTQAYITNEAGKLQPIGVYGELCLAGKGLARGYLNNPEETKEKFVQVTDLPDTVLYRTGDRARLLDNGEIELVGRLDSQIKIRGYRIELSEIEQVVLSDESIRQAVVIAFDDKQKNKQLALYYCIRGEADHSFGDHAWLRDWLKARLPHYMIPVRYTLLDEMPVLPNGKINRKALPLPQELSSFSEVEVIPPSSKLEKALLDVWKEVLNVDRISVRDNFFDVGGNSLGMIQVNNKLNSLIGHSVPLMKLFEHPTIESLVRSLDVSKVTLNEDVVINNHAVNEPEPESEDIAVIGMACKFPGADHIDAFWKNIVSGVDSITRFDDEELLDSGIDPDELANPSYVKAKGFLEGVEYFDSDFFDYPYQEANMMDPQIRIMHQCAWEVLESAGYNSSLYKGSIGLFAGSGSNMPWMTRFLGQKQDLLNAFEAMTLNEKDFLTTRISYKLNLKGPSFNVQTACSTSLVAIHQAAQSLIRGESDMAIAGGISISYPRKEGYLWHDGMIFSKDGHCKPFAEDSSGTVSGNGCGLVLLKPLSAAQRDGDNIYAVIKGSAINNDGMDKIGYTAPSIAGQTSVIEAAMNKSGLSSEDIDYLEAHGTGTKLGDPIEIEALKHAWKTDQKGYCAIGSVKANIGHLDAAAGVAGFIKSVLSLYHRTIPPHIHFKHPNPGIDFRNSPFYINTESEHISDHNKTLRAGVSSFGIGGTNAHVILEQAPKKKNSSPPEEINLLPFSARSQTSLTNTCEAVLSHIQNNPDLNLSDVAWTLQKGRKSFEYRKAMIVKGSLNYYGNMDLQNFIQRDGNRVQDIMRPVIFKFPGEESVYQGGRELYASSSKNNISKAYRHHMNQVLSYLQDEEREHIMNVLYGHENALKIYQSDYRQFAMFATGYAIAKTLIELGIIPDGLTGQGIGEISASAVAGVLELKDAVDLVNTGSAFRENISNYKRNEPKIPLVANDKKTEEALVVHLIRHAKDEENDLEYIYQLLGQIWSEGIDIDWEALHGESVRKRLPLPTYVFDKKYHENDVYLHSFELQQQAKSGNDKSQKMKGQENSLHKDHKEMVFHQLSGIWQTILGCEDVRSEDDFFSLGGHSLKAVTLASEIQKIFAVEMPLTEIFNRSVFSQMADWLLSRVSKTNQDHQAFQEIQPIKEQSYYEVSSAQKRMYAVNEMIDDSLPYNLASVYLVEGTIDREKFKNTIDELVHRHESFRTRFSMIDGEVVQFIEDHVQSVVVFETATENEIEEKIEEYIRPFDLSKAPLLRIKLVSLSEEKHVLFIDMHHIISDQSSIAILLQEIKDLYSGKTLAPLNIQYKDFAAWQNELFQSKEIDKQMEYWKEEFAGEIPKLNMLTDFSRPRIQSYEGDCVTFEFSEELSAQLDRIAKELGLTPYMVLIAALKLVLWKYTGQNDLVIGTGIAGRRHADLDSVVGMFVNTLGIRSQLNESAIVAEYLQYIKEKMVKAYENQDCQYEMLIEELGIEKDLARNPLFDVVINYITMGTEELALEGLTLEPWPVKQMDTKFDFTWTVQKKNSDYVADIEYSTTLFKRETIRMIGSRLLNMVSLITGNPNQKLTDLSIITPDENEWLSDLNQTSTDFPGDKTIIQLFEEQVKRNGQHTAISWGNEHISYNELNHKANRIAELLAEHHVNRGDRIAILLDRSPLQVVSILGILKAGCVYVPIDLDYPEKRINFMLGDSGSCLVLTQSKCVSSIGHSVPYIQVDSVELEMTSDNSSISSMLQPKDIGAEDTAYIIYTSGSTGTPKGTVISHRNVIRVVRDTNYIEISPTDRLLQLSNYAFDGSVFDIFGALLNGASLVMISNKAAIEVPQLTKFIEQEEITVFFITTALFNMLVDWDVTCLRNTRKILFGGEATSVPHVRKALDFLGSKRIINVYGPTESTVFATYYPIDNIEDDAQFVPIGYPISNTTLYILDEQGHPVPPNVPGELYIGGAGIAKGYLNREDLSNQKFLHDPVENSGKVYRTGDLVWRLPTGEIGFIGRTDFQIKIRGFRVEMGEIESYIKNIPSVKEVIVVSQKDKTGNIYIAAYYTVDQQVHGTEPDQIREHLSDKVPDYMVPSRMKKMDRLPLNHNGKIDRTALPVIEEASGLSSFAAPRTDLEEVILKKMQDVLDNGNIGIRDDFFKFGGHSIKAIALVQSLSKVGINLKVNEIFQYPTVEGLAALPKLKDVSKMDKKRRAIVSESEISLHSITLNENQMDSLVQHVQNTCSLISTIMVSANRISQFPFSPVQTAHATLGSSISGFTTRLYGNLDEPFVRKLIVNIIQNNQLLHCFAETEEEDIPVWKECDISTVVPLIKKSVPYLDLREYTEETKEQIADKLCNAILLSAYQIGDLPWRLCCLRLDQDTHFVIWGFDHTAFDGMSGDVIRHQMEKEVSFYLNDIEDSSVQSDQEDHPQKYQEYISLLTSGPRSITEKEIIEQFSLNKWQENNDILMKSLEKMPGRVEKECEINIPLVDADGQDTWWFAFNFTVNLLRGYTSVNETPLAIVDYGRRYNNKDFYNCVGEFLDIIPLLVGGRERESNIVELLKECRLKSINFLSLLFDTNLSKKYSKIDHLLAPSFKAVGQTKKLVLFNFQGYVSKEEKNAFKNSMEESVKNNLANLLVTVNYDEESINISIESLDGLNIDTIKKIIQSQSTNESKIMINH
jgi:amino acid adenylation domain-containing protein